MIKKISLALIAAIVLAGCSLLQKAGVSVPGTSKSYTVDSLKAVIDLGIPLKCSYEISGNEYEGYVKGKQWRGKMKTAQGQIAEIIFKDNCMWSWEEGKNMGAKMCFEEDFFEQPQPTPGQATMTMDVEYRCSAAVVNDSFFTPPANVNFMDPFSQGGGMMQDY